MTFVIFPLKLGPFNNASGIKSDCHRLMSLGMVGSDLFFSDSTTSR